MKTEKPIWSREHFCPSCGFETGRDGKPAMNLFQPGFAEFGLRWPKSIPVEAVTATDSDVIYEVSASHGVEAGTLS